MMNKALMIPEVLNKIFCRLGEFENGIELREVTDKSVLAHMSSRHPLMFAALEGETSYCVVYVPKEKAGQIFLKGTDFCVEYVQKKTIRSELMDRLIELQAEQSQLLLLLNKL